MQIRDKSQMLVDFFVQCTRSFSCLLTFRRDSIMLVQNWERLYFLWVGDELEKGWRSFYSANFPLSLGFFVNQ